MQDVLGVVLGGGRGSRLFPLTKFRSKPAVPIAGKYRIVDIPLSNCLNSHLKRVFVLTQYNSESLNRHVHQTYKFDIFTSGFVTILAAEQTEENPDWFQGTADAIRQSMRYFEGHAYRDMLILSGDQLYQMDYRKMMETHRRDQADITVGVTPVSAEQASSFGILRLNAHGRITDFVEKPPPDKVADLASDVPGLGQTWLASMGIYVFGRQALDRSMADTSLVDFGKNVIPMAVPNMRVQGHVFRGYWEDVGTIASYFHANLALCDLMPPFDFYDASRPIYTHPRFLPATKIEGCSIRQAVLSEGAILTGAEIERTVVGIRTRIGKGAILRNCLLLGADFFETVDEIDRNHARGVPPVGIGEDTQLEGAIIDKNARIGRGVKISSAFGQPDRDGDGWHVRDGVVVVTKNATVPDGTVI